MVFGAEYRQEEAEEKDHQAQTHQTYYWEKKELWLLAHQRLKARASTGRSFSHVGES